MMYILSDNRGKEIARSFDKREIRKIARGHTKNGNPVMIFLATNHGEIVRYSSEDTVAVHRRA